MLHLHWLLAAFGNRVSIHVAYGADCESDEEEKLMVRDISCRLSFILFQFQAQSLCYFDLLFAKSTMCNGDHTFIVSPFSNYEANTLIVDNGIYGKINVRFVYCTHHMVCEAYC